MHKIIITGALALMAEIITSPVANAEQIAVTQPGTLGELLTDASGVTELAVTGAIDAADLHFIADNMPALRTLDLTQAAITEYDGVPIQGITYFAANAIPANMFAGSALTEVKLPQGPGLTLGDGAFAGSALTAITLDAAVDSIGMGAFSGCTSLTELTYPATARLGTAIFQDCTGLQTVTVSSPAVVPAYTFRGCTSLTEVDGSEQITSIGQGAFMGCKALETFDFSNKLTTLGDKAFMGSGLKEANLQQTAITAVGGQAFADTPLTQAILPERLDSLGDGAFFGDSQLTTLVLPNQLISLGNNTLKGVGTETLDLPSDLEEIGDNALLGAANVSSVKLPATLVKVGDNAMENMTGLTDIDVTALPAVPETGSDVWAGVDQSKVSLQASAANHDAFRSAPQWQEFVFAPLTEVNDETIADATKGVRGHFEGTDMVLESNGGNITAVYVYDAAGRLLTQTTSVDSPYARIATGQFPGGVFMVMVNVGTDLRASLKLAR